MAKKKFSSKAEQVKHVSKETNVSEKELERLNQDALQKLDDITPDEDEELLGGSESQEEVSTSEVEGKDDSDIGEPETSGTDESPVELPVAEVIEEEAQTPSTSEQPQIEEEVVESNVSKGDNDSAVKPKVFVGYHPITGKEVLI